MSATACPRCGGNLVLVETAAGKRTPPVAARLAAEASAAACPHCGDRLALVASASPRLQESGLDLSAASALRWAAARALDSAEPSASRAVGILGATNSADILNSDAANPRFDDSDLRAAAPVLGLLHAADEAWDDADRALAAALNAIDDAAALDVLDREAVLKALADARAELDTVKAVRSRTDTHYAVWASQIGNVVHRDIQRAARDVRRALATAKLADALETAYNAVGDIARRVTTRVGYIESSAGADGVDARAADLIKALAPAHSAAKCIAELRLARADTFVDLREAFAATAFAARGIGRQVGEIPSAPVVDDSTLQEDSDLSFDLLEYQSAMQLHLKEQAGSLNRAESDTALAWAVRRGLDALTAADEAAADLAAISSDAGLFSSANTAHFRVDAAHFIALHTLKFIDQAVSGDSEIAGSGILASDGNLTSDDISAAYAELASYAESTQGDAVEKTENRKCIDCGLDICVWDGRPVRCVGCTVPHQSEYTRRREAAIGRLAGAIGRHCAVCGIALESTEVPYAELRVAALAIASDVTGHREALNALDSTLEVYINSPSPSATSALSEAALSLALMRYERDARRVDTLLALDPHREWYGEFPVHAGVYRDSLARALARDAAIVCRAESLLVDAIIGRCESCSNNPTLPLIDLSSSHQAPPTLLSQFELDDSISPDDLPF